MVCSHRWNSTWKRRERTFRSGGRSPIHQKQPSRSSPRPQGRSVRKFLSFFHWFKDAWLEHVSNWASLRWAAPASHSPHADLGHKRQGTVRTALMERILSFSLSGASAYEDRNWGAVSVCEKCPGGTFLCWTWNPSSGFHKIPL